MATKWNLKRVIGGVRKRTGDVYYGTQYSALTGGGERVDIDLTRRLHEPRLDMYQLSHLRRYQFAVAHIPPHAAVADLACGTGYGSALLAKKSASVFAADRDHAAIATATARYRRLDNVTFRLLDLLDLDVERRFDAIVSFETLEHFPELDLLDVLRRFHRALKPRGCLIFSTPFLQENTDAAQALGFHQTFLVDQAKIEGWLALTGFRRVVFRYQSYSSHDVVLDLESRDFIVCVAEKR